MEKIEIREEHELYSEEYSYYRLPLRSRSDPNTDEGVLYNYTEMSYKLLIDPDKEGELSVAVPEEKDGHPIRRVSIAYQKPVSNAVVTAFPKLKKLYIPSSVDHIYFDQFQTIKLSLNNSVIVIRPNPQSYCTVEISPDNPNFCVYKNGIYNKDMTELHCIFSPGEYSDGCFEVPDGVKLIKCGAGMKLRGLKRLVIPESVHTIENEAFGECFDLEYAELYARNIGRSAFGSCQALTHVLAECEEIGYGAFWSCGKLQTVELINTERIEDNAFLGCRSLKEIKLPETLHHIGSNAFKSTGIKRLTIPRSSPYLKNNICDKETVLELYVGEDLSYHGRIDSAEIGTLIAARSSETDEILFEYVTLWSSDVEFMNCNGDLTSYDKEFINKAYKDIRLYSVEFEIRVKAALARFRRPYGLSDEMREFYRSYISQYGGRIISEAIAIGITAEELLENYQYIDLIDDDNMLKVVDASARAGNTEVTAMLMHKLNERRQSE